MEKAYVIRVDLIFHPRIDVKDARTDYAHSPLLPDLSSHEHLRVVHISGLHYRDDAKEWPNQDAMIRTEDYIWEQIVIMLKSAATNLRGIFLHVNDDNIVFYPSHQRFMITHVAKDGRRPGERLGRLDKFNWSSLGATLLACKKLINVFVLLTPQGIHSYRGNRWILYRKTVDAIQSQLPATLRHKLAFGIVKGEDIVFMYENYFIRSGFLSFYIDRRQTTSESSIPSAELMKRLLEAE